MGARRRHKRTSLNYRSANQVPDLPIITMKSIIRLLEFLLFFLAIPLVFYFDVLPVPKIAALLAVSLICLLLLWRDNAYDLKHLLYKPPQPAFVNLKRLLWKSGVVALLLVIIVLIIQPENLFVFLKEQPTVWAMVMLLYPFLSALPQEFLYREFFFVRYKELFKKDWILVYMSAITFSFLHIIYDNPWALLLSLAGGFMFARTYHKNRSLFWVSVEHAIYGGLVFTIGLGNYFYEGF